MVGPATLVIGAEPGPVVHLSALGATIRRLMVTGGDGARRDVSLGYPDDEGYRTGADFLGATIGRYANRIARGRFTLDGREVQVAVSDRGNSLHGGPDGFDRKVWEVVDVSSSAVTFSLVSPDGDQGFPGTVTTQAVYSVSAHTVTLQLTARTDAPTPVNLTSHVYLNLEGAGSVDEHWLQVPADSYTPVDDTGIPVGGLADVTGTPFDLRTQRRVGEVARSPHPQVSAAQGLDHDLAPRGEGWREVARLVAPRTLTRMTLWSDAPGLQVYTGNFLDGTRTGASGQLQRQGDGLCLEPQHHPDSPNRPGMPSAILRPGETYNRRMAWTFESHRD